MLAFIGLILMADLHFIGGEKGGVGKSVFARLMAEFCIAFKLIFVLAECDRMNPDVARIYRKIIRTELAYFTEDKTRKSKADKLFSLAIELLTIANLPAQVHEAMKSWFLEDNLYELGQEHGVSFCYWYVSNGGYDSVKLFVKTLRDFGEYMQFVFVRNWGLCDDWTHVDEDEGVQAAIREYKVSVIDLPKFPYAERNFIEAHQLTLTDALNHPDLSLVSKQRVKKFLRESFAEIEKTGLLTDEETSTRKSG
jgi:hypothetical protein